MGHNGALTWAYAKVDTSGTQRRVYNMGTVMEMAVQHGQTLRDQRLNDYIAAGDAATADDTFKYQERDNTYQTLFENAAAEGRSYTGYQMTYTDYEGNQADVFGAELQQREAVQIQEWDLREKELNDRYEEWQRKMDAILERGRNAWGNAENRYLQEWREWERKVDTEEREGNTKWDEQIAKHFTDKQQWEQDLRSKASEESIREVLTESVNSLNSQILMVRENIKNSTLGTINTTAYVNNAIAELQALQPSFSEQFENINANIANFKTKLSISELVGADLGSAVEVISAEYREELREHEKNMQVQAKVKVFEEYRRMLDEFAFQIQLQNDAIAQQTAAAAMAQGFAPTGAAFVKMSNASGAVGLVNAYAYFEAEEIIDQELKNIGFEQRQGDELIDFLLNKDDVEVEAYFYTQKLALQHIFGVIMGTGDSEARKDSQDEKVIGRFGKWAGKQGGTNLTQATDQVASQFKDVQEFQNADLMSLARNFGGFGEQGAFGVRPGGASLGFYPQLEMMNRMMGNADASELEGLSGNLDPVSAMMNQFNPMVWSMNSYMNVELAAADGKSRGYMWEAQALGVAKQAITAMGSGLIAVSPMLGPLGLVTFAAGTALSLLGGSMQVNLTTGERHTKLTDKSANDTAIQTGTTILTWGSSIPVQVGVAAATAYAQTGMQYDADGKQIGYSLSGRTGEAAVVNGLVGGLGAAAGAALGGSLGSGFANAGLSQRLASTLMTDLATTPLNVLGEYYKQQNLGAEYSNYAALARPDLSNMGKYAGVAAGYGLGSQIVAMDSRLQTQEARALQDAQRANREGNQAMAVSILAGLGYSESRRREQMALFDQSDRTGGQLQAGQSTGLLDGITQRFGNLLSSGSFQTNNQLFDSIGQKLAGAGGDWNALSDSEFNFMQNQLRSRMTFSHSAGVALLASNKQNVAPDVLKLQMEYELAGNPYANGILGRTAQAGREISEIARKAEELRQAELQEKVARQADEILAGGGKPAEFMANYYQFLVGRSMSSVPAKTDYVGGLRQAYLATGDVLGQIRDTYLGNNYFYDTEQTLRDMEKQSRDAQIRAQYGESGLSVYKAGQQYRWEQDYTEGMVQGSLPLYAESMGMISLREEMKRNAVGSLNQTDLFLLGYEDEASRGQGNLHGNLTPAAVMAAAGLVKSVVKSGVRIGSLRSASVSESLTNDMFDLGLLAGIDGRNQKVSIIGFEGAGSKADIFSGKFSSPLEYAGHVGYSFDGGNKIFDFTPIVPADETLSTTMKNLGEGMSYPGYLQQDNPIWEIVRETNYLTRSGGPQVVWQLDYEVSPSDFSKMWANHNSIPQNTPLPNIRYSFPGGQDFGCFNCATMPSKLGIPIPEETGVMKIYMRALVSDPRSKIWLRQ